MSLIPTSTSTEFVLDTNVAIDFLNKPDQSKARIGPSAMLVVPTIVFGGLYRGAHKSKRLRQNVERIKRLSQIVTVVAPDLAIAERYGVVQHALRLNGTPIPQNDAWIAAISLTRGLPLVTRDEHFQNVAGLNIVNW